MLIDPRRAAAFIAGYQALLDEVHRLSGSPDAPSTSHRLGRARNAMAAQPALLAEALDRVGHALEPSVLAAVRSLRVSHWVYLRDTRAYSVFMDVHSTEAFAVLALTTRLRDLAGGSGVTFQTGLVEYEGRYVCDGLATGAVWLGPHLRSEFNAALRRLKDEGRFLDACGPVAPAPARRARR